MLTFVLCFWSKLVTEVVLHLTDRQDSKIRCQKVHFHHILKKTKLVFLHRFLGAVRVSIRVVGVSSRTACVSSRVARVPGRAVRVSGTAGCLFSLRSLERVKPSCGEEAGNMGY